jgi:glycosyltransferase involved in cell wall biosynthesis
MRIVVDTNAHYTSRAGVDRYLQQLLKALRSLNPTDLQLGELDWPVENLSYQQPLRALKTAFRELIWAPFVAPRLLQRQSPDLFHSTSGILVNPPRAIKHVVTLHDLAVLRFPDRFRPWHRRATTRRLKRLFQADRIICISRFTANEAMELLGLPPAKLEVVYNGGNSFESPLEGTEAPPVAPVPPEYLLFVGSLEPGKNLRLVRETYEPAARSRIALPPLVIVGARWEGTHNEGQPPTDWHYLGRQPDPVLVYLLRRALALVFPSKYEGFGIPVIEAMSLNCPVLCSRVASLAEIGGSAVMYAQQTPEEYLKALQRLVNDSGLRRQMAQQGREQARQFSWRRCAEETLAVYRSVINS